MEGYENLLAHLHHFTQECGSVSAIKHGLVCSEAATYETRTDSYECGNEIIIIEE